MKRSIIGVCTLLSAIGTVSAARAADEHAPAIKDAVVVLVPSKGSEVGGTIALRQEKGYVQLTGEVQGLTPGKHGFHIHEFGDMRSTDGMATGGHYNPHKTPHGGLHSKERHAGDFGNIEADSSGMAKVNLKAEGLELHHVLGRAIVVHGKEDDLKTQPAGDAGPRVAVGVIGLAQVK
jgi:Cu-Zn family superoxide dismutase